MLDLLRTRLARVDARPVREIDRDIDDELALHLEQLESDLIESGLSPAAARDEALSRFGNPHKHKRRCRDVALLERRMKTSAQITATIACGLLLAAVSTSLWFGQQSANAALVSMNEKMAGLASAVNSRTGQGAADAARSAVLFVNGDVAKPGLYSVPAGGISVRRLLAVAGIDERDVNHVVITRKGSDGKTGRQAVAGTELRESDAKDVGLTGDDLVTVVRNEAPRANPEVIDPVGAVDAVSARATPGGAGGRLAAAEIRAGQKVVYITGSCVRSSGQFTLPASGLSLRRLLALGGVHNEDVQGITLSRRNGKEPQSHSYYAGEKLRSDSALDLNLVEDDLVTVDAIQK